MKPNQYLSYYIRLFLIQYLLSEKGLSENTILAYRDALKLLLQYCAHYLKIKIDQLPCERTFSTPNTSISSIFLYYFQNRNYLEQ
jgi:site-specific recombinase XerD